MTCEHKDLRCTNGEFFCLTCGKKLEPEEIFRTEEVKLPKKKAARKGAAKE